MITRKTFGVPASLKLNPHEAGTVTKQLFAQELPSVAAPQIVRQVL